MTPAANAMLHPDDDVLEVGFENDAVFEVGGQHRWQQQPQVGVPPGEDIAVTAGEQVGYVGGAGGVLVRDRGGQQGRHPGAQMGAQAGAHDHREALQQCGVAVGIQRAVARFGQQRTPGEAVGDRIEGRKARVETVVRVLKDDLDVLAKR